MQLYKTFKAPTESSKMRDLWITDFVLMPNLNKVAISYTSKELSKNFEAERSVRSFRFVEKLFLTWRRNWSWVSPIESSASTQRLTVSIIGKTADFTSASTVRLGAIEKIRTTRFYVGATSKEMFTRSCSIPRSSRFSNVQLNRRITKVKRQLPNRSFEESLLQITRAFGWRISPDGSIATPRI